MDRRLKLQTILETILGSSQVYFQPPDSTKMRYPAIVYGLDNVAVEHGNNNPYTIEKRYQITILDRDPDSSIIDKIITLPKSVFVRAFQTNDLNHTIFTVYY